MCRMHRWYARILICTYMFFVVVHVSCCCTWFLLLYMFFVVVHVFCCCTCFLLLYSFISSHMQQPRLHTPPPTHTQTHTTQALLHRAVTKRPLGVLKYAMTLDGKIATQTGHSAWVTSPQARGLVFATRALSDAVVVGGQTVRRDNPQLTTRKEGGHLPVRIVMSRTLDLPTVCVCVFLFVFGGGVWGCWCAMSCCSMLLYFPPHTTHPPHAYNAPHPPTHIGCQAVGRLHSPHHRHDTTTSQNIISIIPT